VDIVNTNDRSGGNEVSPKQNATVIPKDTSFLWDIVLKANEGDPEAITKLCDELNGSNAELLISACGDISHQALMSLLEAMYSKQEGFKMAALKSMKQLREDLGWSNSPRIEQMLIERIVLAWQYLHWAELMNTKAGKCSLSHAKYNQERIDRANKRYLSATKMLAMIRKMALPLRIDVKAEVTVAESKSSAMVPRSRFDLVNSTN
jgi:hypothetical protein